MTRLKEEHVVPVEPGSAPELRVKTIVTSDFDWLLRCIADVATPVTVNSKLLRLLASRVIDLVRVDAPKKTYEFDYTTIERLAENPRELASVFGLTNTSNPNLAYPFTITRIAQMLGYNHPQHIQKLILIANQEVGFSLKDSDNDYHICIKTGTGANSKARKYSQKAVDLFSRLKQERSHP